jgi:hypothetical protein
MTNNLHISYDLNQPGRNYEAVIAKIKTLGSWAKIHESYWYVKSSLTPNQAVEAVWSVMDASDTIYVVDATSNQASWQNIAPDAAKHIQAKWNT